MKKNKLHSIFEAGSCLSIEQMQAYLAGKLSAKEEHLFEKHINACAMCRDEFEGLQAMKKPEQLPLVIEELNKNIDKRLIFVKKTSKRRKYLGAAAVILLLIGSVFFMQLYKQYSAYNTVSETIQLEKNNDTAVAKEYSLVPAPVSKETPHYKQSNENKIVKEEVLQREYELKMETKRLDSLRKAIELREDSIEKTENAKYLMATKGIIAEKKEIKNIEDQEISADDESVAEVYEEEEVQAGRAKIVSSAVAKKSRQSNFTEMAVQAYENQQYTNALNLFEKAEKAGEQAEKIIYYRGLTYFSLKKYKKAENYFNMLQDTSSTFYDDALWQKSLMFIEQNKLSQARKTLKQLIKTGSRYSQRAQTKLDSLQ